MKTLQEQVEDLIQWAAMRHEDYLGEASWKDIAYDLARQLVSKDTEVENLRKQVDNSQSKETEANG